MNVIRPSKKFEVCPALKREGVYTPVPVYTNLIPIIIKMNSTVSSPIISAPIIGTKSFVTEQLDTLNGILQEFSLPLSVALYCPDNSELCFTATIESDVSVSAELYTDGIKRIEVYPNCMTFVKECYCLWEQDPEYFHMTTAEDILRSLVIEIGNWSNMTLWHIYRRFPGFMENVGFTDEQLTCRRLLGNLMPGTQFLIRARRVTLDSNHLFSYRKNNRLTCAMAVKLTTGRDVSEEDALPMMYLLDGRDEEELDETVIGYGLSLDEILKTFSLFKLRYLGQVISEYDNGITIEVQQYLDMIKQQSDRKSKVPFVIRIMDFLYKNGIDFIKKNPDFNEAVINKCKEFIGNCGSEYPECSSSCQRLLDKITIVGT